MVFAQGYTANDPIEIDKVVVDLTNWNRSYPMGVLAYDGRDVVCSEYCAGEADFEQFFEDISGQLSYVDPALEIKTDAHDLVSDNASLLSMVERLQKSFDGVVASRENAVERQQTMNKEVDHFAKAKDEFEALAKEKGLLGEEDGIDDSLNFD